MYSTTIGGRNSTHNARSGQKNFMWVLLMHPQQLPGPHYYQQQFYLDVFCTSTTQGHNQDLLKEGSKFSRCLLNTEIHCPKNI